jgi:hypothetical protein
MSQYAKKILFNIAQNDLSRMTTMRSARGLEQSEFIRRAIRVYMAELTIEEMRRDEKTYIPPGA